MVADGQELISAENCPVYPVSNTRQPVCAFFPILREDREPLALLLCSRTGQHLSEMELGCAKLVAAVIANKIATTPVQSILEVSENGVVFETCNSIYRLSYTRVPMELEAMCA